MSTGCKLAASWRVVEKIIRGDGVRPSAHGSIRELCATIDAGAVICGVLKNEQQATIRCVRTAGSEEMTDRELREAMIL